MEYLQKVSGIDIQAVNEFTGVGAAKYTGKISFGILYSEEINGLSIFCSFSDVNEKPVPVTKYFCLFVLIEVLRPSQQQWSCRDVAFLYGTFT